METTKLRVLLIGNSSGGYSPLSNRLRKRGCDCRFAISKKEICWQLDSHSFELLLGPIKLNGDSLYPLIARLDGSRTTLFYSQAVEDGCWWLPALRFGGNCFGTPALRPREFVTVLDKSIEEIRCSLRKAAEIQSAIASRFSGSIVAFPFSGRVSLAAIPVSVNSMNFTAPKTLG